MATGKLSQSIAPPTVDFTCGQTRLAYVIMGSLEQQVSIKRSYAGSVLSD